MIMMMMMMMMTMMTNTIPYRRTKTHIWDKVLMGFWVHPAKMLVMMMVMMMMMMATNPSICSVASHQSAFPLCDHSPLLVTLAIRFPFFNEDFLDIIITITVT